MRRLKRAFERLGAEVTERHFPRIDRDDVRAFDGVVLGPQGVPFDAYPAQQRADLFALIRGLRRPTLGVCGGCQALALAFGGAIGPWAGGTVTGSYGDAKKAVGLRSIELKDDALFQQLGTHARFAVSHVEGITKVPAGLECIAMSDYCAVQGVRVTGLPVWGVQFHPELGGDGERVLRAFLGAVLVHWATL